MAKVGPRIYNLFPPLVGTVDRWHAHARRAAAMGFNWIFLNPIHAPGFSGSLYAIKDYERLNPLFFPDDPAAAEQALAEFVTACHGLGLKVMLDLVINHTAIDAVFVERHPEWYRRDERGDIYRPRAVDPDDPSKVTIWGDLAELDYANPSARVGMITYWTSYLGYFVALGIDGFRCDAAYKILPEVWSELFESGRAINAELVFFAETLGCTVAEVESLSAAGFNYLFNSSKWWDFRSPWLLEQYERFRHIAPSVAFPESHDTERIASTVISDDSDQLMREMRFRYLFAAAFSTGVMIPIGYEYGFRTRLHVVETRPENWADTAIDLSDFIAAVNALRASIPALNQEGPQRLVTAPGHPLVGLLRETEDRTGQGTLLLLNADRDNPQRFDPGRLISACGGRFGRLVDVTPQASPIVLQADAAVMLDPLEIRVFRIEPTDNAVRTIAPEAPDAQSPRIVIEEIWPIVSHGAHAVKRVIGDVLEVWADIFIDGHDKIAATLKLRTAGDSDWQTAPMQLVDNDRWVGRIALSRVGAFAYTIEAWRDAFASWRAEVVNKISAHQSVSLELREGRHLIERAVDTASGRDAEALRQVLANLSRTDTETGHRQIMLDDSLAALMATCEPREGTSRLPHPLPLTVDRPAASFSAWYELFPRSMSGDVHRHGTFADVIAHLPYIRDLGFDVLYMPPIHPIGHTNRKGRNNALTASPNEPGSPYAIGSEHGGHTAIHPQLGTIGDFRRLMADARRNGLEIAIDFAIQCSLDHPWIKEHPEWFAWRDDGSLKYAENPPKKYEDIVNVNFYGAAFPAAWEALRDVVLYWASEGVRLFRVDNPHTKPLPFWEWMIREVRKQYPGAIFLAEAFTRPKMMRRLAKIGFNQSYTYFTWRNTKAELTEYLTELTQSPMREYYRPNFFVNTPDINPIPLQTAPRAGFIARAVLAGTLSPAWGLYAGFELCEATPLPSREEYLNSEKYEIRAWDWDRAGNIRVEIAALNRIRRDNPALHELTNLRFYVAHHEQVLFYGKQTSARDNILLIAVSLDFHHPVECGIEIPLHDLGLAEDATVQARELITGDQVTWHGRHQHLRIDPAGLPCRIWRIERAT